MKRCSACIPRADFQFRIGFAVTVFINEHFHDIFIEDKIVVGRQRRNHFRVILTGSRCRGCGIPQHCSFRFQPDGFTLHGFSQLSHSAAATLRYRFVRPWRGHSAVFLALIISMLLPTFKKEAGVCRPPMCLLTYRKACSAWWSRPHGSVPRNQDVLGDVHVRVSISGVRSMP